MVKWIGRLLETFSQQTYWERYACKMYHSKAGVLSYGILYLSW